jgi:hypothetical protein
MIQKLGYKIFNMFLYILGSKHGAFYTIENELSQFTNVHYL